MNRKLPKSAQRIQEALLNQGLYCRVIELPASTRTAAEAALTIGCQVSQIVKSLIFKTKNTNRPVLVLASGLNRVNEKILEAHIGAVDTSGNKTEDAWPTRWVSIADLTKKTYYFSPTTTPNIIWLDLNVLDFTEGKPILFINPNQTNLVGDIKKQLQAK